MSNDFVTVFGASGFVGRHTVLALARAGLRIRAVSRKPNLANFLPVAGEIGQIDVVKGNLDNDHDVVEAVTGAAAVVNAAGVRFGHGAQSMQAINADAPGRVARAAQAAGVGTLVQVSAIGADIEATSGFARTKGYGERRVRENFPSAIIIRPSLIFGPEDRFFNRLAGLARVLPVLPVIGGRTRVQPVFVGDVAQAIVRAVSDPTMRGRVYELGGPTVYAFRKLLDFVLAKTGRKRILLPMPFALAAIQAFFLQIPGFVLPIRPLLTIDLVRLLKCDCVVSPSAFTFGDLAIKPASVESVVPGYLWRFHPKGQFRPSHCAGSR